jgi:hypothetical protein
LARLCALAIAGLFAATATADPYLTFSSAQSFTIKPPRRTWTGTIEYSTNATSWSAFGTAGAAAASDGSGTYRLYLRGKNNTRISSDSAGAAAWTLTASADVACEGNIETLLDYAAVGNGQHPVMYDSCFATLFKDWTALTNAPALPATNLASYCYSGMFWGCTGLTQAPELPATTLAFVCYGSMFYGCTGLAQAPELPATALAPNCYYSMFYGCTGLTQAPELPATALAPSCYDSMFYGCTGLTQAPELPATALAMSCYYSMFQGCTGLTAPPALPATALANNCYGFMFRGCTGISLHKQGPGTAWSIPAGATPATDWNYYMFNGTSGTFTGWPEIGVTYYYVSPDSPRYKQYLTFSSADAFTVTPQTNSWDGTLRYSTDAASWRAFGTAGAAAADDGSGTYKLYLRGYNNTRISDSKDTPGWTLTAAGTVACSGNIETLLDYVAVGTNQHPAMAASCFANLFKDWTALENAPMLPATALADYCYYGMFSGCTGLTQLPVLPATMLAENCYNQMFYGCTGIKLSETGPGMEWSIPAAAVAQSGWNTSMLAGTGGTFTGNPVIGVIYYCTSAPGPDPDPEAPNIVAITVDTGASTLAITVGNVKKDVWYTLLVADELGDPWAVSPAIQATADGILIFQNVPATLPHRFYKVRASATQP